MSPRTPSFSSPNSLWSCCTHPIPRTALVSPRSPSLRFKKTRIYFKQKTQKKIDLGFLGFLKTPWLLSVVVSSVIWLNVLVKASSSKLVSSQKFFEFLITANSRHLMLFSNNLPSFGVWFLKRKRTCQV
jgi:hypothetical protein